MSVPTVIVDPRTGNAARVTEFGQLAVAPLDFSTPVQNDLTVVNTAVNFIAPVAGQSVIITDILISSDRNVGVNGAVVDIYQALADDTTTIDSEILKAEMVKQTARDLTGLNFIVPSGKWVNAKTDDTGVSITIAFYRVPITE